MKILASTRRIILTLATWAVIGFGALFVLFLSGDLLYSSFSRDLRPWHTVKLKNDLRARQVASSYRFSDYLDQESRLFTEVAELKQRYFDEKLDSSLSRYNPAGNPFAERLDRDWNRSYILEADTESAVAVLIHGLSDSPYSLRSVAQRLHKAGVTVYGLRLPGHGTTPIGLDQVQWEDWRAATDLVMREVEARSAGRRILMYGYSTGAALLVQYAVEQVLAGRDLSKSHKLVLFSPALGVTPFAGFANFQRLVTGFGVLQKARWTNVDLEIDPFKYQSFAKNGAAQLSELLPVVYESLARLNAAGQQQRLPAILSFQSVVDQSVNAIDLVTKLYAVVDNPESELMFFGINRSSGIEPFLLFSPQAMIDALKALGRKNFRLTALTNEFPGSPNVVERTFSAEVETAALKPTGLVWPEEIYSLSHVAIPFPPDDPVYGYAKDNRGNQLRTLGDLQLRGERGVLVLSAADQLRLKANPFHSYMMAKIDTFISRR